MSSLIVRYRLWMTIYNYYYYSRIVELLYSSCDNDIAKEEE